MIMDKEYIREQMILLLMHEETELSEEEIRAYVSRDPALRKEYGETLAMLELAAGRKAPPVSEKQWEEFSHKLRERLGEKAHAGILVKFGEFFRSPRKLAAAASIAAAIVLGIFIVHNHMMPEPVGPEEPERWVDSIPLPRDFKELDSLYITQADFLPSNDELAVVEEIYASFAQIWYSAEEEELPDLQELEFEDLFRQNESNGQKDVS